MKQKTNPEIRMQIKINQHIYPNLYAMLEALPPSQRNAKIMWVLSLFDSPLSVANSFIKASLKVGTNSDVEPASQNEELLDSTPTEEPAIVVEIPTASVEQEQSLEDTNDETISDDDALAREIAEDFKDY